MLLNWFEKDSCQELNVFLANVYTGVIWVQRVRLIRVLKRWHIDVLRPIQSTTLNETQAADFFTQEALGKCFQREPIESGTVFFAVICCLLLVSVGSAAHSTLMLTNVKTRLKLHMSFCYYLCVNLISNISGKLVFVSFTWRNLFNCGRLTLLLCNNDNNNNTDWSENKTCQSKRLVSDSRVAMFAHV